MGLLLHRLFNANNRGLNKILMIAIKVGDVRYRSANEM